MKDRRRPREMQSEQVVAGHRPPDELNGAKDTVQRGNATSMTGSDAYRRIVDLLPAGVGIQTDGAFVYANSAMASILGMSDLQDLLGKRLSHVVRQEAADRLSFRLNTVTQTQEPLLLNEQLVRLDGSVVDVEIMARTTTHRRRRSLHLVIRDVSESRQATKALQEAVSDLESRLAEKSAELAAIQKELLHEIADLKKACESAKSEAGLYRAVIDSAQDLVFSKDRDLRYTLVNPAMERLHGRKASEIVGLRAEDLMSKEAAARIRDVDLRVLRGQCVEEEYMTPIRGGRLAFHGIRVPLRDVNGDVVGMCGIVRNVTESRKAVLTGDRGSIRIDYPSKAMRAMLKQGSRTLTTDGTVLLLGESGSGKDHLARWIHEHSHRADGPYFAINCAAVPKELAESELFGHEAGAFTGARGAKRGLLQLAEGGTLLLNEIGELTLFLQSKLLTFLDTKSFLRVGGERSVHVNARIIAATHRDLAAEIQAGRFLSALFYRLNVYTIHVPPLRERLDDIPALARKMIPEIAAEMQLSRIPEVDDSAVNTLRSYHWPGNVREFRNVLERSLMLWDEGQFSVALPLRDGRTESWSHNVSFPDDRSLHDLTDEVAQSVIREALRRSGGKRAEAARMLGISRGALYRYMKGFGVTRENGTGTDLPRDM